MESVLVVVHLFLAIGLVGLILIQHGKGADMGAAFGSGASSSVFGSRGASNFLSRTTAILATLFFVTSLALAGFAMRSGDQETLMDKAPAAQTEPTEQSALPPSDLPNVPTETSSDLPSAPITDMPSVPVPAESEATPAPQTTAPSPSDVPKPVE